MRKLSGSLLSSDVDDESSRMTEESRVSGRVSSAFRRTIGESFVRVCSTSTSWLVDEQSDLVIDLDRAGNLAEREPDEKGDWGDLGGAGESGEHEVGTMDVTGRNSTETEAVAAERTS